MLRAASGIRNRKGGNMWSGRERRLRQTLHTAKKMKRWNDWRKRVIWSLKKDKRSYRVLLKMIKEKTKGMFAQK